MTRTDVRERFGTKHTLKYVYITKKQEKRDLNEVAHIVRYFSDFAYIIFL